MTLFKIDLHAHTSDEFHLLHNKAHEINYVKSLLSKITRSKTPIILCIADFNHDKRYEKFVKTSRKLREFDIEYKNEQDFIKISNNGKDYYIIKGDEIPTDKGHILLIGTSTTIKSKNLKEVLKEAHKQHAVIIAPHPLHKFGIPFMLLQKIRKQGELSLSQAELQKHKKEFDAVEYDSYFPEDKKKLLKFSNKEHLPLIADSDAHFLNEFFSSYFELSGIDFTNENIFKKSLKKALHKQIKIHAGKNGFFSAYKHGFSVLFFDFLRLMKIIK